jgi:pimeloyl-ACP methyl ester carboxylesterase
MPRLLLLAAALAALSGCVTQRAKLARWFHYAPQRFAGPAPEIECRSSGKWKWCADAARSSADASTILYVLHPAGGSERTWSEYPVSRKFYDRYEKRGLKPPRVVAVSYGKYWTLMEAPGSAQPALLRPFVDDLMPAIELALGITGKPRRLLWGTSQGGLNGASLILRDPDLFERVVLSCPAFYSFPLYSDREADAYITRLGASRDSVYWGLARLRPRIGGPEAWEREGPLTLIAKADRLPPTLVQANPGDEFGFQEGARRFSTFAKENRLPVTLSENGKHHCVIDTVEAIDFLAHGSR